ncbi:fumarate/nitrate reduction transcriptional regulator [compost metagenome]
MPIDPHMVATDHDHTELLLTLNYITPLSEPFLQRINRQLLTEPFKARQLLLQIGEIARRVYYVKSGLLRGYFFDENGKEHTSWFVQKGDILLSASSFFDQSPSAEYIEVLQDSILQSLTWYELQTYYADFREANLIGRMIIEKYHVLSEARNRFLRITDQTQRYRRLLADYPQIEQLTTAKNIASYLGINRETLSRIKSRLLRTGMSTIKRSLVF